MRLVLFGTGMAANKLMKYSLRKENQIIAVVDNDSQKWGGKCGTYVIESPEVLKEKTYDKVLVAVINGWMDVYDQLRGMGIPKSRIEVAVGWSRVDYYDDPLDEIFVMPKKPFVPFEKKPVTSLGHCGGETGKAHARREREGFFDKYCRGEGLDIGCGNDPVVPGCSGWDLINGDAQYLDGAEDASFDFVYSSHCIEHMDDVRVAIKNWFRVVRPGGYLIIYGPDRDLYEKRRQLPSRFNPHHKHMFLLGKAEPPDTLDIIEELKQALIGKDYDIEYIKRCSDGWEKGVSEVQSKGEYSFEIVVRKR